jgi:hypothetical protein
MALHKRRLAKKNKREITPKAQLNLQGFDAPNLHAKV